MVDRRAAVSCAYHNERRAAVAGGWTIAAGRGCANAWAGGERGRTPPTRFVGAARRRRGRSRTGLTSASAAVDYHGRAAARLPFSFHERWSPPPAGAAACPFCVHAAAYRLAQSCAREFPPRTLVAAAGRSRHSCSTGYRTVRANGVVYTT